MEVWRGMFTNNSLTDNPPPPQHQTIFYTPGVYKWGFLLLKSLKPKRRLKPVVSEAFLHHVSNHGASAFRRSAPGPCPRCCPSWCTSTPSAPTTCCRKCLACWRGTPPWRGPPHGCPPKSGWSCRLNRPRFRPVIRTPLRTAGILGLFLKVRKNGALAFFLNGLGQASNTHLERCRAFGTCQTFGREGESGGGCPPAPTELSTLETYIREVTTPRLRHRAGLVGVRGCTSL